MPKLDIELPRCLVIVVMEREANSKLVSKGGGSRIMRVRGGEMGFTECNCVSEAPTRVRYRCRGFEIAKRSLQPFARSREVKLGAAKVEGVW